MSRRIVDASSRTVTMAHGSARAFKRIPRGWLAGDSGVTVPESCGWTHSRSSLATVRSNSGQVTSLDNDGPDLFTRLLMQL